PPTSSIFPYTTLFRSDTIPSASGFEVSHVNLNDNSVEGLRHRELPVFSVQYHPEGCPGPQDSQALFDEFLGIGDRGSGIEDGQKSPALYPRSSLLDPRAKRA